MKSSVIAVARRVRHLPLLEGMDGLWGPVRGVYQRALDPLGRGVAVPVGGGAGAIRVPREFVGDDFDAEEPETVRAVLDYLAAAERAGTTDLEVIDVGCSTGLFTAVALASPAVGRAAAVDSEPPALATCRRLCRHLGPERLAPLHAFIDARTDKGQTADALFRRTRETLAPYPPTGGAAVAAYRCIGEAGTESIPTVALDDLTARSGPPLLIKIDIEGAELRALRGAAETLRARRPTLVLSVHDELIRNYDGSVEAVKALLAEAGYGYRELAVDHERHWWCEPLPA